MYTISQKMKPYFFNLSNSQSMSPTIIILCDLSNVTKGILVINVVYDQKLTTKTYKKNVFFFQCVSAKVMQQEVEILAL